jgi:hypothetical protein
MNMEDSDVFDLLLISHHTKERLNDQEEEGSG